MLCLIIVFMVMSKTLKLKYSVEKVSCCGWGNPKSARGYKSFHNA